MGEEVVVPGPVAALVSFRFGGLDGVSVEAGKWERALHELGFSAFRVAGSIGEVIRPDDVVLPGLAMGTTAPVDADDLAKALVGADLVVVENLCSIPLNVPAAPAVTAALKSLGTPALLHHHDLPWQRPSLPQPPDLPPRLPSMAHVVINRHSQRELAERGLAAHLIHNHFDFAEPTVSRTGARRRLGILDATVLVVQPTRAIPRKNVPRGLAFTEALAGLLRPRPVRYWLTGPAEEGYGAELERLLGATSVEVHRAGAPSMAEAYAAADVVVLPSTSEGFGNPVIEAVAARRPVAVASYPVLDELREMGLRFWSVDRPDEVAETLVLGDRERRLEANHGIARRELALELLPGRLAEVLETVDGPVSRCVAARPRPRPPS